MGSSLAWQTDAQLHDSVQRQLEWDPEIAGKDLAVIASDGAITLTGIVRSYAAKMAAEESAKRVRGVRGVANEIQVAPLGERTDTDIARDAVRALRAHTTVPATVKAAVHRGCVTLEGTAEWMYQRATAESAVAHLAGVKSVANHIAVRPAVAVGQVKADIEAALLRCADVDAQHVQVSVDGSVVTLSGQVASFHEKREAERAVWGAPGITQVDNRITVGRRGPRDPIAPL